MRWIACLVGETHRILIRGGVFLYPSDNRPGYVNGRLRLLYEAFPIAMLVEQAGGAATDGAERILAKASRPCTNARRWSSAPPKKSRASPPIVPIRNSSARKRPCSAERGLFHVLSCLAWIPWSEV